MPLSRARYNSAVVKRPEPSADENTTRLADLSALVESCLGGRLDPGVFTKLAQIQKELWSAESVLDQALGAGEISDDTYLERTNAAARIAMQKSRALLGDKRFYAIFGDAGDEPDSLIDSEAFLARANRVSRV